MEITFNAHGNKKQVEAFRYWIDKTTFDIAYGGSKGCNAYYNQIQTRRGLVAIKDIKIGDYVLTTSEIKGFSEWKRVYNTKKYLNPSSKDYHKLITFVMKGGNIISLTTNHEVYFKGSWLPIGEFARRVLDVHSGDGWEVFCVNPRTGHIPMVSWTDESLFYEWHNDAEGLQEGESGGRSGRQEFNVLPDSPFSCYSFRAKSIQQANRKSYRFRQDEQSLVELRMGYGQRECVALEGQSPSAFWEQEGRQEQQDYFDRRAGIGNQEKVQEKDCYERDAWCGVRGEPGDSEGYNSSKELDPSLIEEIKFELLQGYVYDLQVEDNHNYCVTDQNIIIHNSGKSYLGCSLILGDALMYPGTHYFIARKTLADLRKHTSTSISEVLHDWGIPDSSYKYNGQDNFYLFNNGSRVYFIDCKPLPSDPLFYRFGSIQMTRGMCEEAGEIDEAAKNALAATIGRWKNDQYDLPGKLILTCNPAKNFLYRDYYKPFRDGILSTMFPWRKFIQALPQDNKKLPAGYLEQLRRTLNTNEKKRLLEGNWEYDDDPAVLIDYDKITKIFTNTHVPTGIKCVTADIARLGGDRIVAIKWDGYRGHVTSWKRQKLDYSTAKIEETRQRAGCSKSMVLVDSDGLGSGVQDFGGFVGFRNNGRPLPDPMKRRDGNGKLISENFDMLKSQCGFRMAEMINEGKIYLTCEDEDDMEYIIQELEQVKQKEIGTDGKKGLLPKEDVIKLLGRSPDFWDAILMRKYFDLRTAKMRITHRTGNDVRPEGEYGLRRRHEWNP